ncbi:two-component system, NtrC family, response regulator [Desulfacinum hydrothermale DSM 13146]|uniref:Two-component system, NtrC family, response regulator n=1 Tax=Desulfacinum hydrothermale DSM 13146 TaxID=1121390 RepID=A0A1W1X5A7_9BACT|nr:sigma-54 dependent transcriptional regulator [Desulfacinum hydrothermale]SMC19020.1 two-component system, NtrC family, response regulator [Desulfacinum hydrothermale DSM 13146]
MGNVLIIDDEKNYLFILEDLLQEEGHSVLTAQDGTAGLDLFRSNDLDVVVTDMKMPGMDGMEVLERIRALNPDIPVVMMTAYGTVEKAVEAMKKGAFDYIMKPFENEELKIIIGKACEHYRLIRENRELSAKLQERYHFHNIIGKSASMQSIYELIEKVAPTKATVLVTGESGTGKELIARAIHYNSPRKDAAFISVNCGALPENLLESELFGHERGAFSGAVSLRKGRFEMAHGGTLFLDEISEMSPPLQVKLLRALQEMAFERVGGSETLQVDVRVVAASNRNLKEEVAAGRFRSDLYFRLNVVHILLPPLRERKEDIPLLIKHFLTKYAREMGRENLSVSSDALRVLLDYSWPGNVRELENVVERAVILCSGDAIGVQDLPPEVRLGPGEAQEEERPAVQRPSNQGERRGALLEDLLPPSAHRDRQLRALDVIRVQGFITNRDYSKLNEISERQALRELTEMLDLGVVVRVGKGRGCRYVLPENT